MKARALLTSALFVVAVLLSSARVRADVIRVPSNAGTINIAFALSAPYDTILVAPGTYKVNLEWPHKQGLKLLSEAGPTQTVLDGSGDVQVIGIYTGVDTTTVISGFTIRNGHAEGQ